MIPFQQARQFVVDNSDLMPTEKVDLASALNRVLASSIESPIAVPQFDNSAMDGYAVNSCDLSGANKDTPITLELIGLTAAGDGYESAKSSSGKAWKIMTGAPVPAGFDSIIPVENTQLDNNLVTCFSQPNNGAHIRRSGEDFCCGDKIASVGDIINANTIMALAALGIPQVECFKVVDIAVFSTGKELVDDPTQDLGPGQIRNSNKPYILDWFEGLPVNAYDAGTNYDDVKKFTADLKDELDKNTPIIISSGAVSMGDFDFIPQTIKELGGEIIFHKSKIRPGKPILFAKFPNGTCYFGLPGNPISAAIGLRFFVSTCLRKQLGLNFEKGVTVRALNGLVKKAGFRSILKASASVDSDATLVVKVLEGQESFKIQPLLKANGWALIDEQQSSFNKGDLVEFYPSNLVWS